MQSLALTLSQINRQPIPKHLPPKRRRLMKTLVIYMPNNATSTRGVRGLVLSIDKTGSDLNHVLFPATEPTTIESDIQKYFAPEYAARLFDKGRVRWEWPVDKPRLDVASGLTLNPYQAANWRKVIACSISHMRAWQECVNANEPIMVLEHDAVFLRRFIYDDYWQENFTGGIVGINDPRGATRKSKVFYNKTVNRPGFRPCPYVDEVGDTPVPNGLAGNSAYIIKPRAADALLEKTARIGIWPNDALICNQFFPWLQVFYPYITGLQDLGKSTTTS